MSPRHYHKMHSPHFTGHSMHEGNNKEAEMEAQIAAFLAKFKFWTKFKKKSR